MTFYIVSFCLFFVGTVLWYTGTDFYDKYLTPYNESYKVLVAGSVFNASSIAILHYNLDIFFINFCTFIYNFVIFAIYVLYFLKLGNKYFLKKRGKL